MNIQNKNITPFIVLRLTTFLLLMMTLHYTTHKYIYLYGFVCVCVISVVLYYKSQMGKLISDAVVVS